MPYPTRTAVLDPDTPDVEIFFRLLSPPEGTPLGYEGVLADGVKFDAVADRYPYSRKSGLTDNWGLSASNTTPATSAGVAGLSKDGWGIANYLDDTVGVGNVSGISCVWTKGVIFTTAGGILREPAPGGAPFGLWLFSTAVNDFELPSFQGGSTTFTVTYEDIYVDWAVTASQLDISAGTPPYFLGQSEAPLSTTDIPAMMQFWRFNLPIDPQSLSNKIYGLETTYTASVLDMGMTIMFDVPVHDTLDLPNYALLSSAFSETDLTDNWVFGNIYSFDIGDNENILTRFDAKIPMFDAFNDPSAAIFDHYIPVIQSVAGPLTIVDPPIGVTDGWLIQVRLDDISPLQWVLVSRDWTTYQRMSFSGGEQAFCDNSTPEYNITYMQDTDGTWLALTRRPNPPTAFSTDYKQWIAGEINPGFTGCTGGASVIPPAPTAVTGDVTVRAWPLPLDGHDMYVLRLGLTETLLYDKYSKQWFPWSSLSNAVWAINTGFEWLGGVGIGATNIVVGDDTTGTLYFLDPEQPFDNPQTVEAPEQQIYFDRIVMGQLPLTGRDALPCYAIFVTSDMGDPAYDGASMTLYTSDDAGATWDDHGAIEISVSVQPELLWISLGQITAPGRLFMLIDDGAVARIDGMQMNDPDDA